MPPWSRLAVAVAVAAGLAGAPGSPFGRSEGTSVDAGDGADAPVIVFVHGFQGFGGGPEYTCRAEPLAYPDQTRDFDRLAERVHAAGARVYVARYTSNSLETDGVAASARCLGRQIAAVRDRHGVAKVVLVGHSLGGIVSRGYVEGPDYGGDVSTIVTFGAPHEGVPNAARLLTLLYPLPYGLDCGRHPGACELFPERMARFNQRFRPVEGVSYRLVGGTRGWLASWLIRGEDDGLVSTSSAVGSRLTYAPLARSIVRDAHSDFGGRVTDHYLSSPESADCLLWAVGLRSEPGRCPPVGMTTGAAALAEAEAISFTPMANLAVLAGVTEELSLLVDGRDAQVLVGWSGVTPTLSLQGPDGAPRSPDSWAWRHAPGSVGQDAASGSTAPGGVAVFDLPSPRPGPWRLLAASTEGPVLLHVFAALSSDIRLEVEPAGAALPGASVGLGVSVSGAACASGACTLGAWLPGALSAARATVTEHGAGELRVEVQAPERPGLHLVAVRAAGRAPDGTAFEREEHVVLEVVRPSAGPAYLPIASAR